MSEELPLEKVRRLAYKHALINAIKHEGKAQTGPVVAKVIGEEPELRAHAREIARIVSDIVSEVNSLTLEEQVKRLREEWPEALEERPAEEKKGLPPLPNVEQYRLVVTRFAPNPDFVLTLGNARAAILSHEYARMYKGKFILRFEDTDPRIKAPLKEAYELIKEDLKWLGIRWDEEHVQSLRMEIFYEHARRLIRVGGAYVDTCTQKEFQKLRNSKIPCPHRDTPVDDNLELWDKMVDGWFGEGEAVLRVKTDLNHPDPPVRDWVAFRIIDTSKTPHPLTGDKYVAWPTYNFAAAVDDHLMGVTHILRGKEHAQNTVKQSFLYQHFNWKYPETIHFGRLRFEGIILSKSHIRRLIEENPGEFRGYDDPRFGTLAALRRRGFLPETIREIILEVGVKPSDATISMDNIAAVNRKIVDQRAPRLMFVDEPATLILRGVSMLKAEIPFHPDVSEMGTREIVLSGDGQLRVYVSKRDLELFKTHEVVRLMELANVKAKRVQGGIVEAEIHSLDVKDAKRLKAPIIQWVPEASVPTRVIRPERDKLLTIEGLCEVSISKFKPGSILQFIRYGFVRVDMISRGKAVVYYAHP